MLTELSPSQLIILTGAVLGIMALMGICFAMGWLFGQQRGGE
jgi:uncharacterized protein involved in exopolysaccharide biosynthesis